MIIKFICEFIIDAADED